MQPRCCPVPVAALFVVDGAVTLAYFANWAGGAPSSTVNRFLNLAGEANLPAWYSSLKLGVVGILWILVAAARGGRRSLPAIVSAFFLALSFDETASFHEWLGVRADLVTGPREEGPFPITGFWMLVLGLPAGAFAWWLVRTMRDDAGISRAAIRLFAAGFAVYLAAAAGVEIVANFVAADTLAGRIQVCVEEFGEMAGATLLFWATLHVVRESGFGIRPPVRRQSP